MPAVRLAIAVALATALGAGVSSAGAAPSLVRPTGIKAFLLTPNEPAGHSFPRTPSFAWNPVRGALRYEFQLATTTRFNDNSIVWTNVSLRTKPAPGVTGTDTQAPAAKQTLPPSLANLRTPALGLPLTLPWITGEPYSLYARIRAVLPNGATPWSTPYGFNVRWPSAPEALPGAPGLLRWTPVDGATSYEVWIFGAGWAVHTTSNTADLRELYNFHQTGKWIDTVRWRVRAERRVYGPGAANGLPTASYGPWSPVYTARNPEFTWGGPLKLVSAISDVETTGASGRQHRLMPSFTWAGTSGSASSFSEDAELWRVYVATDRDCVNVVFRGAIVGSPAYAPRVSGTLEMPHSDAAVKEARDKVLELGEEGDAFTLDGSPVKASEAAKITGTGTNKTIQWSKTDLWDNASANGGYYWTVVPVVMEVDAKGGLVYRDLELAQDACRSGRVMRFGKTSDPVIAQQDAPFASGMSTRGLLSTASRPGPTFYGMPLVAWKPALGAEEYQVQWSRKAYPWTTVGGLKTGATSALLDLKPGRWFYRVRGLNRDAISKPQMAWSTPVRVDIAKPVFRVARSGR